MVDMAFTADSVTLEQTAALDPAATIVVTVNNRLVWRVHGLLLAHLRDAGAGGVLQLPPVWSLSKWLEQLHQERLFNDDATLRARRLSPFAARLVWEDVVGQLQGDTPLLDTQLAAMRAMAASRDQDEWQIEVLPYEETEEYRRYRAWRDHYERRCREYDADDDNRLYNTLIDAVRGAVLRQLPATVVLVGFNEYSPRLRALLLACADQGMRIVSMQLPRYENAARVVIGRQDRRTEWVTAAHWAASELAADPSRKVAIISPQMQADAVFARRILDQELSARPFAPAYGFNMSVGRALAEWPLVRAAFHWLSAIALLAQEGELSPQAFGQALLSGFCGASDSELSAMAVLDARLRESRTIVWRKEAACGMLDKAAPDFSFRFKEALSLWQSVAAGAQQTSGAWTDTVRQALALIGFPGAQLSSTNFQVCAAFDAMLHDFSLIQAYAGKVGGLGAVSLLQRMARENVFQPQRDPDVRLDVLGFLEAEHGQWDAVWILGLTDEVLPASPDPNPFLPAPAQARAGAPRATPEREKQWAQDMLRALCAVAPKVVLSYPMMDADRALRPSALLDAWATGSTLDDAWAADALSDSASTVRMTPLPLESREDRRGLAATGVIEGGSDLLETQALNPLWAYVRHRLGARALQPYPETLTATVRGTFLHDMAQKVWEMLGTSERLAALAEAPLAALVNEAVEMAAQHTLFGISPALADLEKARAAAVMMTLLAQERTRPGFRVAGVEQAMAWEHAALKVNMRVDRIDETDAGETIVMDYKSGQRHPDFKKDWLRPRPVNLQLPLYATILQQEAATGARSPVMGLLFAKLNARKTELTGLTGEDLGIAGAAVIGKVAPGVAWDALLQQWQDGLRQLACDLSEGVADNNSWALQDLQYCDVLPFLRLAQENEDE